MDRLEETDLFQQASCIALYHAIPGEVQTAGLIEKWYRKKRLLLPLIKGNDLQLLLYAGKESLKTAFWGQATKRDCEAVPESEIDLTNMSLRSTGHIIVLFVHGRPCAGTGFIGKVGNDAYGKFYRQSLLERGTEANLLVSSELPSGVASTFISPDGERTFGTYLGAAATLKAEDLSREMFKGYTYLFIEGYLVQDHDMILRAIELAKEAGLQICLDMASYNIVEQDHDFFSLLINKYVDIVFANEEEAKAFTGKEPEEALDVIAKMCSIAIVKLGARGSLIRKGTEEVHVHAVTVDRVIDTTGAGDYFAAGFLYGLTCGYSLEKMWQTSRTLSSSFHDGIEYIQVLCNLETAAITTLETKKDNYTYY